MADGDIGARRPPFAHIFSRTRRTCWGRYPVGSDTGPYITKPLLGTDVVEKLASMLSSKSGGTEVKPAGSALAGRAAGRQRPRAPDGIDAPFWRRRDATAGRD